MRIKKVINNNILCVVDEKGREMIVTGKGLGFQRKVGERADPALFEKTYHMEGKAEQRRLRELVEQIPMEHLKLTEDLIQLIKSRITAPLNESLLITLADHISFAIKRKEKGVEFTNPLQGAIMSYYPTEYHLGQHCLRMIQQETELALNPSEASFIAMHIVNAELNTSMSVMYDITKLIEGALEVTEYFYQKTFDRESLDFNRFVVHLRYFAQRLFQAAPQHADEYDRDFQEMIIRSCKRHYKCAQCIGEYIRNTYQKTVSDEELIYLTIHLKRINLSQT
ncbi:PRD domain-containing protein [Pseudoflavonifractor sp. 524-17]|uniref:BglG family transcription antiterminator LicT n=1 Tax=Pseudoflavonifractor sp. 524-17 TaxID=2304577 RepID=UPI00137B614E|nr:PRD domain-containing protein [Pseudoflavonifractor sp. 524-17]NCE63984.1 PRD domain-containing protein [Pseudoflavonifractor sp. 524-17]